MLNEITTKVQWQRLFFSFCVVKKKHKRTVNSCYNCFFTLFSSHVYSVHTDKKIRIDDTWVVFPPPLLLYYQQHRNCSLMQNMLSWCLHVSSEPSQRFNNTKYCTSSSPSLFSLPPFLIGSHLCILVTQSAPSPPEPAGQEAQALRVPTAGV